MTHPEHEILLFVRQTLSLGKSIAVQMAPVTGGGSSRSFQRVRYGNNGSVIFMQYDRAYKENNYYAAIAEFLRDIDVPAPRISAHDPARGFIVMEDLGDVDLWSFRPESWPTRSAHYRKTLAITYRLHSFRAEDFPSEKVPLMEGFGPDLYRWERNYFCENFVQAVCGITLSLTEGEKLEDELRDLSDRLETIKTSLVHRDLQSRNIMICKGEPVFIDFQGMRFGNLFYDLGSLLYDPYVSLTEGERMELLQGYYQCWDRDDWSEFQEKFREASAQRLMQALGAYGFLGLKRGLPEFLSHIPNAIANLLDAATRTYRLPLLRDLALRCQNTLKSIQSIR